MLDKIKKNYFLLISTILFLYFFFNLLDGERGLVSYFEKKNILNNKLKKNKALKQQEIDLNYKISLLNNHSPNLDLLDEKAFEVLGLAPKNSYSVDLKIYKK